MSQVVLEIYNSINDEQMNRRLSRKLALLCYFLNTRLDCNTQFVHGGVFGRQFTNNYNPNQSQTRYELVVNKNYVINNAFYLDDDKLSEDDFRGFSQVFVQTLAGLNNEFSNFKTYQFRNYAPIVVGNYYLKESGIDGRTLNNQSYNAGVQQRQTYSNNFSNYQNLNMGGSQYSGNNSYVLQNKPSTSMNNVSNVSVGGSNVARNTVVLNPSVGISSNVSVGGNVAGRNTVVLNSSVSPSTNVIHRNSSLI